MNVVEHTVIVQSRLYYINNEVIFSLYKSRFRLQKHNVYLRVKPSMEQVVGKNNVASEKKYISIIDSVNTYTLDIFI